MTNKPILAGILWWRLLLMRKRHLEFRNPGNRVTNGDALSSPTKANEFLKLLVYYSLAFIVLACHKTNWEKLKLTFSPCLDLVLGEIVLCEVPSPALLGRCKEFLPSHSNFSGNWAASVCQWRSWSLNHHQCHYLLVKDNKLMTLCNLISMI